MKPFPILAILFLVVPLIEIYFLVKVGQQIGAFSTILLVILTAVVGVFFLRQQGLSTLQRFQANLTSGGLPAEEMVEGVLLLFAGALLLTPGFFTDFIGFLCVIPFTRKRFVKSLLNQSAVSFQSSFRPGARGASQDNNIYDGEYRKKPDDYLEKH